MTKFILDLGNGNWSGFFCNRESAKESQEDRKADRRQIGKVKEVIVNVDYNGKVTFLPISKPADA